MKEFIQECYLKLLINVYNLYLLYLFYFLCVQSCYKSICVYVCVYQESFVIYFMESLFSENLFIFI